MKKGISLHLGLNYVDPNHYDGWKGELFACEADAKDMADLAEAQGFKPTSILTKKATAKTVKKEILKAAKALKSGDTFFLTYSGHGGQVPDTNGDEGQAGNLGDRMDETWCLYDRQMVDDELAALYSQFKPGVRILVLSDSCHSGTVIKASRRMPEDRVRVLPPSKSKAVYLKNQAIYEAVQAGINPSETQHIEATVLLISGCQDDQLSRDGDENGLFTGTLKRVWAGGQFIGDYRYFHNSIVREMPWFQIPNYFINGAQNVAFENEKPFTVGPSQPMLKAKTQKPKKKAKKKQAAETPIQFVLRELEIMGMLNSTPGTDVSAWFSECEKIDGDLGLPLTRTDLFLRRFLKAHDGVLLGKSELLQGKYKTPQVIANLAG